MFGKFLYHQLLFIGKFFSNRFDIDPFDILRRFFSKGPELGIFKKYDQQQVVFGDAF